MDRMMATPNGYSSDCGAPGGGGGGYPYRYQHTNEDEGSSGGGDLSFLYDRAQGNSYNGPQQQGAATTQFPPNYSTPASIDHQSIYNTPSSEYKSRPSELGQGLMRATPAPAYPYSPKRDVHPAAGQPHAESLACPTGRDAGTNQWPQSPPQVYQRSNVDARDGQVAALNTDQQRGPETLDRPMSNLRVSTSNQPGSVSQSSSSGSEVPQDPRPRLLMRTDPTPMPPASPASGARTARTIERSPQKLNGVLYNPPASPNTLDPRRNYIRQNIPWRDINAARKFSVPLLNRPRLQVADHASDDQMVNGNDPLQQRSIRQAPGEVDSSSQRQLLREGDEIGEYDQKSIRYKGRANPSKMFRFVQSKMGSSDSESIEHHQNERRKIRRQKRDEMLSAAAAAEDKDALKDADDVVDISYVGSKIPSRTFRFLQEAIGERDQQVGHVSSPSPSVYNDFSDSPFAEQQPARTVKVVHLRPQKSLENLIGDF